MNYGVRFFESDTEGRPDGWPREVRKLSGSDTLRDGETLMSEADIEARQQSLASAMEAWETARNANSPYLITDLFDRFTPQERSTIRTLAQQNDSIADLWDNLLALREGVEGPPDGATPGRLKSQAAKSACAAIFGTERADQIFARP